MGASEFFLGVRISDSGYLEMILQQPSRESFSRIAATFCVKRAFLFLLDGNRSRAVPLFWGRIILRILEKRMSEAKIAKKGPYVTVVEAGKTYYWCFCGRSANQPLCDGSHKGSEFAPVAYKAEKDGSVAFCGCKRSGCGVMCDGTHSRL